jgi:MFS family permease
MRIGVFESGMFESAKEKKVARGNILSLFKSRKNTFKYLNIILVAVPVWYVMGVLVGFAPEMMEKLGVQSFVPENGKCVMFAYLGITIGDFGSGLLSQLLKSRKKALGTFLFLTGIGIVLYFTVATYSEFAFYSTILFIGFATGYWAVFMSTASELFGTNIRATVTTTAPNFVRGSLIFVTMLIDLIGLYTNRIEAIIITGIVLFIIAILSLWKLEETFNKDLNYIEESHIV